jgi:hypothetical protein
MSPSIFGLTLPQLAIAAAVFVLAVLVVFWVVGSMRQTVGARGVYQDFAAQLGLTWSPPKNAQDTLGPGRVKGRYRAHTLTLDSTAHSGAARRHMTETTIRVRFARSLGLGINGGSGSFRARSPRDLALADPRLGKALRLRVKDEAGARRLLDQPAVVAALLALDQRCAGMSLDDGSLACKVPLPTSTAELRGRVDLVVEAAAAVNEATQ